MTNILGAILAGGKSSRYGRENKALATFAGKPLVQHVIDRLQPQTSAIIFSGEEYELVGVRLQQVPIWVDDIQPGQAGPLIALLSCLEYLQDTESEWLLTSACDTPFLPHNLAEKLVTAAQGESAQVASAHDGDRLQPANSVWHRDLYPTLKLAIENGVQGFHQFLNSQFLHSQFLGAQPHAVAKWPSDANYFININTPVDLEQAEKLVSNCAAESPT